MPCPLQSLEEWEKIYVNFLRMGSKVSLANVSVLLQFEILKSNFTPFHPRSVKCTSMYVNRFSGILYQYYLEESNKLNVTERKVNNTYKKYLKTI